jgi:hypothetical protein
VQCENDGQPLPGGAGRSEEGQWREVRGVNVREVVPATQHGSRTALEVVIGDVAVSVGAHRRDHVYLVAGLSLPGSQVVHLKLDTACPR